MIGVLSAGSESGFAGRIDAFRRGIAAGGFVEGQTVTIAYRYAEVQYERLPDLARDLVDSGVVVIFASGTPAITAAMATTKTVPIVINSGRDPVRAGFVPSLNRPGGNVTGINFIGADLVTKRLSLLRELRPSTKSVAILINPENESTLDEQHATEAAARTIGLRTLVVAATNKHEIESAFATAVAAQADGIVISAEVLFGNEAATLVALAAAHRIPAIAFERGFVAAGGLMSYGASVIDAYYQAGVYVARILKGANPAELPVLQASKFEMALNLKTAKALGLDISPNLLAQADEVIE